MINLKGKNVLVTAGSRGLGAAIVRLLVAQGANVAFTYVAHQEIAEALCDELADNDRQVVSIQADARDYQKAKDIVENIITKWGRLHILINNAGIGRGASLLNMTEEDWDDVIDISLKSAFNYTQAIAHHFVEHRYGKVVCVGSINGLRGRVGTISYNSAKAGLSGFVKTAAAELGQYNVNVNLVAPGYIHTKSQEKTPELIRQLVLNECAIKRLGTPEDIANAVVFLASDTAQHITGQIIKVDAGQYL